MMILPETTGMTLVVDLHQAAHLGSTKLWVAQTNTFYTQTGQPSAVCLSQAQGLCSSKSKTGKPYPGRGLNERPILGELWEN